ncbi:MAG: type VII toxin-antitoxin system MntA family adenylyltransferase antitoxin [Tepidimonas ignava]
MTAIPVQAPSDAALRAALDAALPEATMVWLHGSAVRGPMRTDSDVDLAVWLPHPPSPERWLQVTAELSQRLGRNVDLLDLARASTVTQFIVLSGARLLRARDPKAPWLLWARVLREWQDLQRQRTAAVHGLLRRMQGCTP